MVTERTKESRTLSNERTDLNNRMSTTKCFQEGEFLVTINVIILTYYFDFFQSTSNRRSTLHWSSDGHWARLGLPQSVHCMPLVIMVITWVHMRRLSCTNCLGLMKVRLHYEIILCTCSIKSIVCTLHDHVFNYTVYTCVVGILHLV